PVALYLCFSLHRLFFLRIPPPPRSTLFPYTTLFRSLLERRTKIFEDVYGGSVTTYAAEPAPERKPWRKKPSLLDEAFQAEIDKEDRKSTRLNSSHVKISYAVFCLKKKKQKEQRHT